MRSWNPTRPSSCRSLSLAGGPDRAPRITGDQGGRQAFAFEFGYIAALIQLMNQEG